MNLFDAQRAKTLSDCPQLAGSVDAVPILYIDPVSPTEVELSAWVRTRDGNGFVSRSCAIEVARLGAFMMAYINDPELVLAKHFDWTAHMAPVKRERDPGEAMPKARKAQDTGIATIVSEDEL